ncbi:MAG TPA: DUF4388 domain-containing protein [Drouetiella sp.]
MIQNQRQDNRHNIRLPNQANIPDLKQIYALQNQAQTNVGRTVELPFGEAPEEYVLTLNRDKAKGDWLWMLYRGQGGESFLEWSYVTPDPGVIHNVIAAQFPGSTLKPKILQPDKDEVQQPPLTESERLKISQSITGGYDMTQSANQDRQSATGGFARLQRATLEGELENLSVPNLLQSISIGKMTGRLEIASSTDVANVYFFDGAPLHCSMRGVEGDAAIIELVSWDSGAFRFYPEPKTRVESVKKRLDVLLIEGAAFTDQLKYLSAQGLALESFLMRKHNNISETKFDEMTAKAACSDMRLLKGFYQSIDSKSTLVEILRRRPLPKTDWIAVLYGLVSSDLVQFISNLPEPTLKLTTVAVPAVDWQTVRSFEKSMLRADTELYTFPAYLYFVEKEFTRFERFSQPFSIIIIEAGYRTAQNPQSIEPLPLKAVKEMSKRIDKLKRKTDLLGHYETFGLGLLLPLTDGTSARSFASRLADIIVSTPLSAEIDASSLVLTIGTASVPESCQDLGAMLAMARPTKA